MARPSDAAGVAPQHVPPGHPDSSAEAPAPGISHEVLEGGIQLTIPVPPKGATLSEKLSYINQHRLAGHKPLLAANGTAPGSGASVPPGSLSRPDTAASNSSGTSSAAAAKWMQPSGPRRPGEGVENEEQGIIKTEQSSPNSITLSVTLLAAGFIIGPSGASVRDIMRHSGADIRSWTEGHGARGAGRRPCRVFQVEGGEEAVMLALDIMCAAIDRYKELCEGKCQGQCVPRLQQVLGVDFSYQPPPRNVVPSAAALLGHVLGPTRRHPPSAPEYPLGLPLDMQQAVAAAGMAGLLPPGLLPFMPGQAQPWFHPLGQAGYPALHPAFLTAMAAGAGGGVQGAAGGLLYGGGPGRRSPELDPAGLSALQQLMGPPSPGKYFGGGGASGGLGGRGPHLPGLGGPGPPPRLYPSSREARPGYGSPPGPEGSGAQGGAGAAAWGHGQRMAAGGVAFGGFGGGGEGGESERLNWPGSWGGARQQQGSQDNSGGGGRRSGEGPSSPGFGPSAWGEPGQLVHGEVVGSVGSGVGGGGQDFAHGGGAVGLGSAASLAMRGYPPLGTPQGLGYVSHPSPHADPSMGLGLGGSYHLNAGGGGGFMAAGLPAQLSPSYASGSMLGGSPSPGGLSSHLMWYPPSPAGPSNMPPPTHLPAFPQGGLLSGFSQQQQQQQQQQLHMAGYVPSFSPLPGFESFGPTDSNFYSTGAYAMGGAGLGGAGGSTAASSPSRLNPLAQPWPASSPPRDQPTQPQHQQQYQQRQQRPQYQQQQDGQEQQQQQQQQQEVLHGALATAAAAAAAAAASAALAAPSGNMGSRSGAGSPPPPPMPAAARQLVGGGGGVSVAPPAAAETLGRQGQQVQHHHHHHHQQGQAAFQAQPKLQQQVMAVAHLLAPAGADPLPAAHLSCQDTAAADGAEAEGGVSHTPMTPPAPTPPVSASPFSLEAPSLAPAAPPSASSPPTSSSAPSGTQGEPGAAPPLPPPASAPADSSSSRAARGFSRLAAPPAAPPPEVPRRVTLGAELLSSLGGQGQGVPPGGARLQGLLGLYSSGSGPLLHSASASGLVGMGEGLGLGLGLRPGLRLGLGLGLGGEGVPREPLGGGPAAPLLLSQRAGSSGLDWSLGSGLEGGRAGGWPALTLPLQEGGGGKVGRGSGGGGSRLSGVALGLEGGRGG